MKQKTIIVMSIKPKYAKAIYEGRKNWEFRKSPPPLFKPVFLYESEPVKAVTGVAVFGESITGFPTSVFEIVKTNRCFTRNLPGISLLDLEEYAGQGLVTALRVTEVSRLQNPIQLACKPPQNWGRFTGIGHWHSTYSERGGVK